MNNQFLSDIISSKHFITAYRGYDVCHNINNVVKIRSINNFNFDITMSNFKNVYYYEDSINGQKIPFIYGDNDSFIKFPNVISNSSYTICSITKYMGIDKTLQNSILTYSDKSNIISIGQYNRWSGIVYNNNTIYKSSSANNNNNWVVTCFSFNPNSGSTIIIGSSNNPIGNTYSNIDNFPSIVTGQLSINNNSDILLNSQWALSHLFIFNSSLEDDVLSNLYTNMISYLSKPATNDLILYKDIYPRSLPSCISENFANNDDSGFLNLSVPLWAGYYAGDYDEKLNILPEINGNKSRNITSDKLKNISFDSNKKFIYGKKSSSIIFPENSLNSNFTICTITKYTSTDRDSNNMIIQSTENNDNNLFYHGHFNNKKGVIMYDNFELSKGYPSTDNINDWVVTCAKNTNSSINPTNNVLINDNYQGLYLEKNYNKISKTLTINFNNANNTKYNSDWALYYILIWNANLSDADLKKVSNALNNFLTNGTKISFNNININTNNINTNNTNANNTNTNDKKNNTDKFFICPGLNISSLQKKMLLL